MYHLGYIKLSEFSEEQYIRSIEKECFVEELNHNMKNQQLETTDGIIIFGCNDDLLFKISEVILTIKEQSNAFIWIIAKKLTNVSQVVFLQLGADGSFDIEQPLDIFRLSAINALKRKVAPREPKTAKSDLFALDNRNQALQIEGCSPIQLTHLEYKTVELLAENLGNTVTYKEIFEKVWNKEYKNEKYRIVNIMFHIRKKIEEDFSSPMQIKTVRSSGYLLCKR